VRIAFVAEYPKSADRVVGGVQSVVHRLATAMARRPGLEVHVVSFELDRRRPLVEEMEGVRVHRFPMARRLGNVTLGREERRGTARALQAIRPDVAHAQLLGAASLGTAESGIPWVASAHGIQRGEGRLEQGGIGRVRAWARSTMEDMSLRRLRHLIVTSPYVEETLGKRLNGIVTHSIENPVDEAFFRVGPGGDPRIVLVPARLIPRKDPFTLVEAAGILRKRGERFTIRFTGDPEAPEYVGALRRRVSDLELGEHVEFLGSLPVEKLLDQIEDAGVVALSSREETSPLAVMEAMAAGRPVATTDVGGTRHLVEDPGSGWIVPPRNPAALARALAECFADPARARRFGERGREIAQSRFQLDAVVDRTLAVYEDVLASTQVRAA
jgi:glycosyltransferase involved in cell wall biosynthesis